MTTLSFDSNKAAVAALLLVFLAVSASIAAKKNNTWDEPAHVLAGYAYLRHGSDYLAPRNHPVAGRGILSLPLLLLDLDLDRAVSPEDAPGSDFHPYAVRFLYENRSSADTILFLARLMNILVAMLLGAYVFVWARELWGDWGAYLSLFLFVLSPDVLAHSSLATTDMPVTAFFFIACYYLYRMAATGPDWKRSVAAAFFSALALSSKYTAVLLLPIMAASLAVGLWKAPRKRTVFYFLLFAALAYSLIWALYGFRYRAPDPSYVALPWERFSGSALWPYIRVLRKIRFLPESYLYGLLGTISGASGARTAFLMGNYSNTGWRHYFITAYLVKTPVPAILLFIAATLYSLRDAAWRGKALVVLAPVVLIFGVASFQNVNIGVRHVLPAYPFMFALIGFVPGIRTPSMKAAKAVFYGSIVWYAYSAAMIFPHQLAYFNEFAGGPRKGYEWLVDSNLDWGQDLKGLKDYMDRKGIKTIKLAYFGLSDPAYFGIDYEYMPSYAILNPRNIKDDIQLKGWFAVSATMLQGVYLPDRDLYRVFREARPVDNIGYSIYIYRFD